MVLRRLPPIRLATPPGRTPTRPTRQDRHRLRMPAMPDPLPRRPTLRGLQHLVPTPGRGRPMPALRRLVAVTDLVADNQYSAPPTAKRQANGRGANPTNTPAPPGLTASQPGTFTIDNGPRTETWKRGSPLRPPERPGQAIAFTRVKAAQSHADVRSTHPPPPGSASVPRKRDIPQGAISSNDPSPATRRSWSPRPLKNLDPQVLTISPFVSTGQSGWVRSGGEMSAGAGYQLSSSCGGRRRSGRGRRLQVRGSRGVAGPGSATAVGMIPARG